MSYKIKFCFFVFYFFYITTMNKKLIIIIILLLVIVGGLTYFSFQQHNENKEMAQLFALDKQEMENEYNSFATQYDELQVQINNDSLKQKLESEKLKTQRLLEELRQVKTTDAAEIARLKKELKTVRAVLRTYIIQIDSLNRLNEVLTNENKEVKMKYSEATSQINSLSQEKKNLNQKVTLAAQLDATNISISAKNKKGKETDKVSNVKKLAISFSIVKNITAETGERTLYIRIAKPDNDILSNGNSTFTYENRSLDYSIKKYIEYTGEEQNVTVYWDVQEYLPAGTYNVYIFAEGNMIGQKSFSLK